MNGSCGVVKHRRDGRPDAGHAFLFQDASNFIPAVERFLG